VQAEPVNVDELLELGLHAADQHEPHVAEEYYRAVIAADPLDVRARQVLGALLAEHGRAEEAVDVLKVAAALIGPLRTDTTGVYNNLANAMRCAEKYEEAEELIRELCRIAPRTWEHWHNFGQLLKDTKRLDEAVAAMRRAVVLGPDYGPNHAVLGHILHDLGRLRSAEAAIRRCIDLGWDTDVNVWTVLGNNYRWLGRMDLALEALERALALSGEQASAYNNLAIVLTQSGRFAEAFDYYDRSLADDPDNHTWRANRGYALLTAGKIPEGWHEWEHGIIDGGPRGGERRLGKPRWTPDDTDTRVLCYREQGVGDEILFASCLPDLRAAARDVVYEADTRLVSLFARSFADCDVRAQTFNPYVGEAATDFDRVLPVGSLPLHFRRTVDAFPTDRRSFLVADPARVAKWRETLDAFGGAAKVAIAWRSKIKTAERRVEYTNLLEDWAPLFAIPDITWVNVQYDDCERELSNAEREFGVQIRRWDDIDYMNDFEEVAALMRACDLVVAPRNAVAMLAGGLGVPTVMMGNRWDWSDLGTDTSPWFPSVQLVFRHFGEEWDAVIQQAARRVASVAAGEELRR
jgi:tetratricopeptide (TPR) repeat protein